jgi:hypothetical protein
MPPIGGSVAARWHRPKKGFDNQLSEIAKILILRHGCPVQPPPCGGTLSPSEENWFKYIV